MVRRFGRLQNRHRMLLTEAVYWLAVARIALVAMPFRNLAARFGAVHTPAQAALMPQPPPADEARALASEVGWAVTRAARYVPFRAVCLPQAIAAKAMLDRRHIANVMHFGVATRADGPMDAHAWLDAGGIEVTGYPVRSDFVEVVCFL
jgi:hypothetical protein